MYTHKRTCIYLSIKLSIYLSIYIEITCATLRLRRRDAVAKSTAATLSLISTIKQSCVSSLNVRTCGRTETMSNARRSLKRALQLLMNRDG